jgi:hypothetical protein
LPSHVDSTTIMAGGRPPSYAPFERVPDEIISRIFTLGAEGPPSAYWPMTNHRGPAAFTGLVSLVNHRWYAITRARSNAHLWHSVAIFRCVPDEDEGYDPVDSLKYFAHTLSKSAGADLHIHVSLEAGAVTFVEDVDWGVGFHFLLVALRLLQPYSHQLADLVLVWNPPYIASRILHLVSEFRTCSRLRSLRLIHSAIFYEDWRRIMNHQRDPDDLDTLYTSSGWSRETQENSFPWLLDQFVYNPDLEERDVSGAPAMKLPTGSMLHTLELWNWSTIVKPCTLDDLIRLLDNCPALRRLTADLRYMSAAGGIDARRPTVCSQIRRMKFVGPEWAIFAVLAAYLYPPLSKMTLFVIEPPALKDSTGEEIHRIRPPLQLSFIHVFKYFSPSQIAEPLLEAVGKSAHVSRICLPDHFSRVMGMAQVGRQSFNSSKFPLPLNSPKELRIDAPPNCPAWSSKIFTRVDLAVTELLDIRAGSTGYSAALKEPDMSDAILASRLKTIVVALGNDFGIGHLTVKAVLDLSQRLVAPNLESMSLCWKKIHQEKDVVLFSHPSASQSEPASMEASSVTLSWRSSGHGGPIGPKELQHIAFSKVKVIHMDIFSAQWLSYWERNASPSCILSLLGDPIGTPLSEPARMKHIVFLEEIYIRLHFDMDAVSTKCIEKLKTMILEMAAKRSKTVHPLKTVRFQDSNGDCLLDIARE